MESEGKYCTCWRQGVGGKAGAMTECEYGYLQNERKGKGVTGTTLYGGRGEDRTNQIVLTKFMKGWLRGRRDGWDGTLGTTRTGSHFAKMSIRKTAVAKPGRGG